jgi:hypothetical protein
MKHFKWPRPPLVLGYILGGILERYMFISIERYGGNWMLRPMVVVLFAMALLGLLRPFVQDVKAHGGWKGLMSDFHAPQFRPLQLFPMFMLGLVAVMMAQAVTWNFSAKIIPMIVGSGALFFCLLSLLNDLFKAETHKLRSLEAIAMGQVEEKMHMDIGSNITHLDTRTILLRGTIFFGWLIGFLASMALIGLIPTVPLFVIAFMRIEGPEPWKVVLPMTIGITLLIYGLFDQLLSIPWPGSVLGDLFPSLKGIIPSI